MQILVYLLLIVSCACPIFAVLTCEGSYLRLVFGAFAVFIIIVWTMCLSHDWED